MAAMINIVGKVSAVTAMGIATRTTIMIVSQDKYNDCNRHSSQIKYVASIISAMAMAGMIARINVIIPTKLF